jgi:hypothetical protein
MNFLKEGDKVTLIFEIENNGRFVVEYAIKEAPLGYLQNINDFIENASIIVNKISPVPIKVTVITSEDKILC